MADEIKIKAPSVEQNININVTGEEEIRRLYTELQAAQATIDRVNTALQSTENELERVQSQFDNFAHGNGLDVLQDELVRFRDTAARSVEEFRAFLQTVNLNDFAGSNDRQFEDLFEQIRDGSMTASQAIMRVKTDFRSLMEESYTNTNGIFDVQMVQEFNASLEHLGSTMSDVVARLDSIEQNGVKSIGSAGAGGVTNVLEQIETAARGMSQEVKDSYESIISLVNALNSYANIDSTKLLGISQAFRNIADIGKGSFGTKSIENIVYLTKQLQSLSASGASIRFDFTGLNDLKVSKASVSNLATYLPQIAAVNVSQLEKLSQVNLTNFNNVKVSKGAIENIAKLTEAIQVLRETKAASVTADDDSIIIDSQAVKSASEDLEAFGESANRAANAVRGIKESLDANEIGSISTALEQISDIDQTAANALARTIEEIGVTSGKVSAKMEQLGDAARRLVSINVSGINADGGAINYLLTYDKKTGEVKKKTIEIANSWGEVGTKIKEVEEPSARVKAIFQEIDRSNRQTLSDYDKLMESLGGDAATGENASRVKELRDKYVELMTAVQEYKGLGAGAENQSTDNIIRLRGELQNLVKEYANLVDAASKHEEANEESLRRLGDDVDTYQKKIDNLISSLRRLKDNSAESKARVTLGKIVVDEDGASSNTNDMLKVSDAINVLIDKLNELKRTATGTTSVKDFNSQLNDLKAKIDAVKKAIDSDADAKRRDSKADKELLKDSNALSKAIITTNRAYKQATDALQKYTAAKNGRSSKEYADIERASEALKSLDDRLRSGAISEKEYIAETNKLKAVIQQATAIIKANGEAHLSLGDKMKLVASKFSQYLTAAKLIQTAWRAMRQMVQASIELDDAFTQLRIVTNATDAEMVEFSKTAVNLAKNLGQSVASVTKSIETFSRLGYSLPDASVLAEYATILANTASVSTDEATTGLTSIIKGFNLDVQDAEHIADVLIEIGQKYAVSASEMMEAYEKSGAALHATNTSLEKSAGLIAAANASVQNASTVGTALKTVSARIRGSKSDLEELGEDTEELAEGFSKYAEELKALTGFNIMVDGSTTQFKDLYDIMDGIAGKWSELSDTQQARVAEILGGTRQLQVIASIIGNWGDATDAYSDAMSSAGAATQANSIYLESATAHINQFKAAFEELSSDIVSSDLIGFLADVGSVLIGALDTVTNLTNVMGTLPGIAMAIYAAMSIKNVGELINQFQFLIILRIEYAHEAFN